MPSDARFATPPAGSYTGLLAALHLARAGCELQRRRRGNALQRAFVLARVERALLVGGVADALDIQDAQAALARRARSRRGTRRSAARRRPSTAMPVLRTAAIALLPPHATYSVLPSGVNASAIGLAAQRRRREGRDLDLGACVSFSVSTSVTESEWPLATASSFSSALSAICDGARPTVTSRDRECLGVDHAERAGGRRAGHRVGHHRGAAGGRRSCLSRSRAGRRGW